MRSATPSRMPCAPKRRCWPLISSRRSMRRSTSASTAANTPARTAGTRAPETEQQPVAAEAEPDLHPVLAWEEDAEIRLVPTFEEELPEPQGVWVTAEPEVGSVAAEVAEEPEPVAAEVAEEPEPVAA